MHEEMFTFANGDRPGVPNLGIVITDGVSTINKYDTIPQAYAARRDGIAMFAIGVGSEVSPL